jgi:hypothetical protein
VERVVVVVTGVFLVTVLLVCCVTVVMVWGAGFVVRVVLQKHEVSDSGMIKLRIPNMLVLFISQLYSSA